MFVVTYRKIFYAISVLLIAFSVFAIAFWGLNLGIDFKGGSILEVEFKPASSAVARLGRLAVAIFYTGIRLGWCCLDRHRNLSLVTCHLSFNRLFRFLQTWLPLAVILIAGATLRLHHIGSAPPGLYYDEGAYGLDALRVLGDASHGEFHLYFAANNGRELQADWL